mmetsp:Transcript_70309/g.197147  ORF Transcript_70309/g.197147 Transcript_70309/m.197147 type:complete len:213 (+) Transcript_70309:356-994(+)
MIQGLKLGKHVFPNVISVQTTRGCQNGQLGKRLVHIHRPRLLVPFLGNVLKRLLLNLGNISLHTRGTKSIGHGLELHLTLFAGSIVDHIGPENGLHKVIALILIQHVITGLEKQRLGFGADQEGHSLVKHWDCKDGTIVLDTSLHHVIGRLEEFRNNADKWNGNDRAFRHQRRRSFASSSWPQKEPPEGNQTSCQVVIPHVVVVVVYEYSKR